jgi:hypothetical protein
MDVLVGGLPLASDLLPHFGSHLLLLRVSRRHPAGIPVGLRGDIVIGMHRDEMQMRMRHVESGDDHAHLLRLRHDRERGRQALCALHERAVVGLLQREEIGHMQLGDDQQMPWIDRMLV